MSTRLPFSHTPSHLNRYRFWVALVVISLLGNSLAPVVYAQSGGPVYLPLIANGQTIAHTNLLFRTLVTVETTAQWQELERLAVVILDQGDDWALLLVDDEQLEALARWRYNPDATNALETLAAAYAAVRTDFGALLSQLATIEAQLTAARQATTGATAASTVRQTLRAAMHALSTTQLTTLAQAATVDSDNDGLSDDQESWWCTDPAKADSDFDGAKDGAEVTALRDWLKNKRNSPPSTGKPFQGWPNQSVTCSDDDYDAVPDLAEWNELGLRGDIESTDRDQFDDGQELFGTTKCPGSGTACGYGSLPPANTDGLVLFPEMPGWVGTPGNHPLVASLPQIKVDVDNTNLKVTSVTEITTDHVIESGVTSSYSTAKTEGTSTSVANTETWNQWEEVSTSVTQPAFASQTADDVSAEVIDPASLTIELALGAAIMVAYDCIKDEYKGEKSICRFVGEKTAQGIYQAFETRQEVQRQCIENAYEEPNEWRRAFQLNSCFPASPYPLLSAGVQSSLQDAPMCTNLPNSQNTVQGCTGPASGMSANNVGSPPQLASVDYRNQSRTEGQSAMAVSQDSNSIITVSPLHQFVYPILTPSITQATIKGKSYGGALTTTSSQYQQHTVTNGEAFSNSQAWGNATAVNSAHAADLRFSYTLLNTGTDFARHVCEIAFNIYIGDEPNPVYTYDVANDLNGDGCLSNIQPNLISSITRTSQPVPLSLEQMRSIDLGQPIRVELSRYVLSTEDYYASDAINKNILVAIEDGTDDGNETIDTYLIPTWGDEKVLDVLRRYFPHTTDANKNLVSISTPEYGTSKPAGCQEDYHVGTTWWCKHALSTADWWNVYTDGLGDGSEGFQDTSAVPGSVALFRFNRDTDLDGFSDRSEARLGTAINDATSFPKPEVLAGLHSIRSNNKVTATLSLLNTGLYDAYGVEAVMVAPDDSISITNNTVGGSGRVRALKQVIVGSRIALPALTNTPWSSSGHAVPAAGGYYVGSSDRTYNFVVNCPTTDCTVGAGTWTLNWSDGKGRTGSLPFGSSYKSPVFQAVDQGLTVALYTGTVKQNETFTVQATTPRDTFQYTINREPHTKPLVLVSYNDPQGNHRFVVPSQAMSLTTPIADLNLYAGTMLHDVGVELVTTIPFTVGVNSVNLLVNNPSTQTVQNAHLFLEMINISGTVVAEIPTEVTLPPGPTSTAVSFNTALFDPPYQSDEDYIVMAFLTDYQGNILDTAGRPLSSFQVDPRPNLVVNDAALTWNFGTLPQGAIAKHPLTIANTGYGRLYTYFPTTAGITLNQVAAQTIGAADAPNYELTLRTAELPVGAVDRTITLTTSDPDQPTRQVRIQGTVTAVTADGTTGVLQRPLDVPVTVTGTHSSGEWVTFTHTLGPDAQKLHPVKVYSQDYGTLYGMGKYVTAFGIGVASSNLFGNGSNGDITIDGDIIFDPIRTTLGTTSVASGQTTLDLSNATGFHPGYEILIYQVQGTGAGTYEFGRITSQSGNQLTLQTPLQHTYTHSGSAKVQVQHVPHYRQVTVTANGRWRAPAWDGNTGGILAFRANGSVQIVAGGIIDATARGFRGGTLNCVGCSSGNQGESYLGSGGKSTSANDSGGGGGQSDPSPSGNGSGNASGGAGGGHATVGNNGVNGQNTTGGRGGAIVGNAELTQVFFGGGGGAGGAGDNGGREGGPGGNGGGLLFISGSNVSIAGALTAAGQPGTHGEAAGGGGGGAGGTIYLAGRTLVLTDNQVSALGGLFGTGSDAAGGNGGNGRIRIEYCESLTGSTTPVASTQKLNCYITDQVETAPYTTARLALPTAVSGQATYNVQFGHKLDFAAAGNQLATIRVPAGLLSTATFDLLVTEVAAGDLTVKVDIGNDGSWEWQKTTAVTNAATFASDNLAPALNAYWTSHSAPTTGIIDIPVRVSTSKTAIVFITNFQQLNLTAFAGTPQLGATPLDVTVALTGSHSAGEWVTFTHDLGPEPQHLQPVKVYSQNGDTLLGVGKYATDFGQGTASANMFGDGRDGDLTLNQGETYYIDNARTSVVATAFSGQNLLPVENTIGFNPGDVILVHQTRGHPPSGEDAGKWEIRTVASVDSANLVLTNNLSNNYYDGGAWQAQVIRIPQYRNVTLQANSTLTAHPWDDNTGGIVIFKAHSVVIPESNATITASGLGFRGGSGGSPTSRGMQGESYFGTGSNSQVANGGGGGGGEVSFDADGSDAGGGGGFATGGTSGTNGGGAGYHSPGAGGNSYGGSLVNLLLFGSGGGGGGGYQPNNNTGNSGGSGGGTVVIYTKNLSLIGSITSTGANGQATGNPMDASRRRGAGGGGAGGSIFIVGQILTLDQNHIVATPGYGGTNNEGGTGGTGGNGRIRIEYCNTLTGTTNPAASTQKLDCYIAEQIDTAPYTTARLNLPESFSAGRTYTIQFGRKVDFAAAGVQVTALRVPAGLYSSAHLNALISGLPANASFALDVGNDGAVDWSSSVTNNSTNASPDLAAAFTAYWRSQDSPTTGTLDVPIKVTLDQPGQLLLTNLRVETTGSRVRYVRLPVQNYATFHLDFTLGETGAVAIDVGDNGLIDWSTPADTLRQETENLAGVINGYLNGKSGMVDVPLRFYLAPDAGVTLNDYRATVNRTTDLIATQLHIGPNTIQAAAVQTTTVPADTLVPVQATLRNGGNQDSGPVTAAFFAYAKGWGDWYIGSAYLENLAAGATTQITTTWDTTGFSGTLPVKVVINPYGRVPESNAANNTAQAPANVLPPSFPPTPDFTAAPRTGTAPLTVVFTSTVTPTVPAVTSWAWRFGDGGTSDQPQPVYTYTTAGLYTVTLTIVTAAGTETKTRTAYIAVNVPPPPVAAFSATPTSGAAPLTVQFTDQSAADVTAWAWHFGDGAVSSSRHPSHTYTAAGVYTVTLTVTSPGGSVTKTQPALITVGTPSISASIALTTGWNLVALPVQPVNPAIDQVLAPIAGKYTMVYVYNGCDIADPWKKYDPAAPLFANDLTQLQATQGFWIKVSTPASLAVSGSIPVSVTQSLCAGWNLVSYPRQTAVAVGTALTPILACAEIVYAYVAADRLDYWKKYAPAAPPFANDLTELKPGLGYWLKAKAACTWPLD